MAISSPLASISRKMDFHEAEWKPASPTLIDQCLTYANRAWILTKSDNYINGSYVLDGQVVCSELDLRWRC
jgi:hypothetical protein